MARFEDQDLTDAEFRECDLTRARLIGVVMQDAVIDGLVTNLVVNGVEVTSYVEAELDRRHPVRLLIRSAGPADLREASRQLRVGWAATLGRLQGMPEGSEHQRVGGEWSAVQTLRHLVFVHDSWFRRCCLGSTRPFTAIGLALRGYRPICEIQFDGFVFPAFDQIVSQLAKMRYRSRCTVRLPVVVRIPFGGGIGAVEHHSESPEVFFAHTAGLRVVACSDAAEAYTMIQLAIASDDPVIFFEPKRRYWDKAEVDTAAALDSALPMTTARTVMEGTDVTVLAYGPMVRTCVEAAVAAREDGRAVEVIDVRSLVPLDTQTILGSLARTHRLFTVEENPRLCGWGAEIVSIVADEAFYDLDGPAVRITTPHIPLPAADTLEDIVLPTVDRIAATVRRSLSS